ncbi:hypothetical protein L0U88_03565 [Flavihumibacter sp. RY-1]|uniref:GLPGLI family protein n=1 Tax=Flavihumibacter fluminis TaxID=2909236 RepID=A0ABS9BF32_9BACT|nr:hypothetical protein [Flavihumibacter fluminis]MCF1713707.1 hypothetical protein [Flavihumibacter fluminis]
MKRALYAFYTFLLAMCSPGSNAQVDSLSLLRYDIVDINHPQYIALQKKLAQGWNTWNNHSMLSQVLLPQGLSVSLGLKDRRLFGEHVREFYPMENETPDVVIRPGKLRSFDGKYTDVEVEWKGIHFRVESAVDGNDMVWLITPIVMPRIRPHITIEAGMLWQRSGNIAYGKDKLLVKCGGMQLEVGTTEPITRDLLVNLATPYLIFQLNNEQVGVYVGRKRSLADIRELVCANRASVEKEATPFGELRASFQATQAILGWSTIYEPMYSRVVTPGAGRWWNKRFNNYVL